MSREWLTFEYFDPKPILVRLAEIAKGEAIRNVPEKVASLRTHELRPFLEMRQAALFCYLMSAAMGKDVEFSPTERSDYDCVVRFAEEEDCGYVPVQLKELVPSELNPQTNLQQLIEKLKKYSSSKDLAVAIHLNRDTQVQPGALNLQGLSIGELWLYGAVEPDQSEWLLLGDLLGPDPQWHKVTYPTA